MQITITKLIASFLIFCLVADPVIASIDFRSITQRTNSPLNIALAHQALSSPPFFSGHKSRSRQEIAVYQTGGQDVKEADLNKIAGVQVNRRGFLGISLAGLTGMLVLPQLLVAQVKETEIQIGRILNWISKNSMPEFPDVPKSFGISRSQAQAVWDSTPDTTDGSLMRIILNRGLVVYDGALAQLLWMISGNMEKALGLTKGYLGKKEISEFNALHGTFAPGDAAQPFQYAEGNLGENVEEPGWLFRLFSDVYEQTDPKTKRSLHWEDWQPIAGENAWAVMAALQIYWKQTQGNKQGDPDAMRFATTMAETAIKMQSDIGGVRFAPKGTFIGGSAAISHNYYVISTENNLSWYGAFRMLYQITGDQKYRTAMTRIANYMKWVWSGDHFAQGARFTPGKGWVKSPEFATDCQTWAVLALGPEVIDQWFGVGTTHKLLQKAFQEAGVYDASGKTLLGVDFTNYRNLGRKSMVSFEWTGGAIMAARAAAAYYESRQPQFKDQLSAQASSMWQYCLSKGVKQEDWIAWPYATGTAAEGQRMDQRPTGHGWFAPVEEVMSLASGVWMALLSIGTLGFNPFWLAGQLGARMVPPQPRASAETKLIATLQREFSGPTSEVNFARFSREQSNNLLNSEGIDVVISDRESRTFSAFDLWMWTGPKADADKPNYHLVGHKQGNRWTFTYNNAYAKDQSDKPSLTEVLQDDPRGDIVIRIPVVRELQKIVPKTGIITSIHINTGKIGDRNVKLNNENHYPTVKIYAASSHSGSLLKNNENSLAALWSQGLMAVGSVFRSLEGNSAKTPPIRSVRISA